MARPPITIQERKDILALVHSGLTRLEVAEIVGRDRDTVARYATPEMLELVDDWQAPTIEVVKHRVRARKSSPPTGVIPQQLSAERR
jgi:hypothetical protein